MRKQLLRKYQLGGYASLTSSPASLQFPDYAALFAAKNQPMLDLMKFLTGLITMNSSDLRTALKGKQMFDESIDSLNSHDGDLTQTSSVPGFDWSTGFSTLSKIGNKIGGTAGNVMSGIGGIGTGIKTVSDASKAAKAGLAGAGSMKAGGTGAIIGAAADMVGSFLPEKDEYSGPKGDITLTMDSVYDGIADAAMSMGPYGMLVGGIMKGGAFLGKGMNALGGGTDGMTTTDAILGSSFLNLTPIGLINGFGGAKADTITKDNLAFGTVGASYSGSSQTIDDALLKSGKKYGLFSSNARNEANKEIAEAKRQLAVISDISDNATERFALRNSTAAIHGNLRRFLLLGGYNQKYALRAKDGTKIDINRVRLIVSMKPKLLEGGSIKTTKPSYLEWVKDVNPNYLSKYYDLETAYQYLPLEQLNRWKFAVNSSNPDYYMRLRDENGLYPYHLGSIAPIDGTEDYIFLKKGKENENPELHWETDTYHNGSNGLKETHDLVYEGDRYYYRKKSIKKHGDGGTIDPSYTFITLVDLRDLPENEEDIEAFREGGSINIIPEGALHARKHNMDMEGITKKGIPVVDNNDTLQAEIEREEIIFRLEVTSKLEELQKLYDSDESSQSDKDKAALEAGLLLVKEILHNTIDNTNNLL